MQYRVVCAALLSAILLTGSSCAQLKKVEPKKNAGTTEKSPAHGWLGVSIVDMSTGLAHEMNLKAEKGALVQDVRDGSPAEKAGIKENDVIVEFDGKEIADAAELQRAVRRASPGSTAPVVVLRKDEKKSLSVKVGEEPLRLSPGMILPPKVPRAPHLRIFREFASYGLRLSDLNRQLGEYFEAPNGRGVLVQEVEESTEGEKSGFKAGDVIVRIGKESVEDTRDFREALENFKGGETADVEIIRKGTRKTLGLKVDAHEAGPARHFRFRSDILPHDFEFEDFDIDTQSIEKELQRGDELRHNSESLKFRLNLLKEDLRGMGKTIKEEMKSLQEKLRKELTVHPTGTI